MMQINAIHRTTFTEGTFIEGCSQLLYDMINKVKEVFWAILQTLLPCFFSSTTLDANTVTQLTPVNSDPQTTEPPQTAVQAVQQAQGLLAQQPSGPQIELPVLQSAPGDLPVHQPALQEPPAAPQSPLAQAAGDELPAAEGHPLLFDHAVEPQQVVGNGAANQVAAEPQVDGDGAANQAEEWHDAADQMEAHLEEWQAVADQELPPEAAVQVPQNSNINAGEETFSSQAVAAAAGLDVPPQPIPVSIAGPSAPFSAAGPSSVVAIPPLLDDDSALPMGGGTPPALTPRRQSFHVTPGTALPTDSSAAELLQRGLSGDSNTSPFGAVLSAGFPAAAASSAADVGGVFAIPPLSDDEAEFPPNPSNPNDTPEASTGAMNRARELIAQLKELRRPKNIPEDDDVKENRKASQIQKTQRKEIITRNSKAVGYFAACAMAVDWKQDFKKVIAESSEFDETLRTAKAKFDKHRKGDFLKISRDGGMQLEDLGSPRSRHKWANVLQETAQTRQEPLIVILTNAAYSKSYSVRIAREGRGFVYHLFSPNAKWNPKQGKSDPIYQSFTSLEDLKEALPTAVREYYYAYELTGLAKYQNSNGTGDSDQFAAAASALPPGGVLVEDASSSDE